jgi:hypothetical protein
VNPCARDQSIGTTYEDDGDAHQPKQLLTFRVVFFCDFYGATREPVHVLYSACFLRLGVVLGSLLTTFKSFRELSYGRQLEMTGVRDHKEGETDDSSFQIRRFSVKHVHRFDAILHNSQRSIEQSHQVTMIPVSGLKRLKERAYAPGSLSSVICEQLAILLTHGDEELVYAHGRVDGHFATEQSFDVVFLQGIRWRETIK